MPHHSSQEPIYDDQMKEAMERLRARQEKALKSPMESAADALNLGATGQFPEGKISENDEGEIQFAVTDYRGSVIVNFGKPVHFIGMNPDQARGLADALIKHADRIQNLNK